MALPHTHTLTHAHTHTVAILHDAISILMHTRRWSPFWMMLFASLATVINESVPIMNRFSLLLTPSGKIMRYLLSGNKLPFYFTKRNSKKNREFIVNKGGYLLPSTLVIFGLKKTITKICPLFQFAKQNLLQESDRTKKTIKKY